jgi:hypothetical protein
VAKSATAGAVDDVPFFPVAAPGVPVLRRRLSRSMPPVFAEIYNEIN